MFQHMNKLIINTFNIKDESKNNGGKKHVSKNVYLGLSETFCRVFWFYNELCGQTAICRPNWGEDAS